MALLTISARQIKTNTCANNVDPDETARNDLSHQDLHCLQFCFFFVVFFFLLFFFVCFFFYYFLD